MEPIEASERSNDPQEVIDLQEDLVRSRRYHHNVTPTARPIKLYTVARTSPRVKTGLSDLARPLEAVWQVLSLTREARDSFRQGVRGVGAIAGTTRDKLPGVITQASGVVAGDELFKALNQQSNNRQQAPTQPFIAGPDPTQSYYANMRALGETPSGGNPFEQSWMG